MKNTLNSLYYDNFVNDSKWLLQYYLKGQKIGDQMKVVGEEDLSLEDYIHYQKSEFFDASVLQQNSFDKVDAGPSIDRTRELFLLSLSVIKNNFNFSNKEDARIFIMKLISLFRDMNITDNNNNDFNIIKNKIQTLLK